MVHSKNNDFEDVPGYDIDSPLPITEEDMFNSLNGAQLPPRLWKPPLVHGTTPTPSLEKKTRKNNTLKKNTAPLANSACTNQCNSNSNNNKKKRGRKKSSNGIINPTSVSVAPYIPTGNPILPNGTLFLGSLLMSYLLCVEHTDLALLSLLFLFLTFLFIYHALILNLIFHVEGTRIAAAFIRNTSEAASVAISSVSNTDTVYISTAIINNTVSVSVDAASVPTTASTSVPNTTTVSIPTAYHTAASLPTTATASLPTAYHTAASPPNASLPATAAASLPNASLSNASLPNASLPTTATASLPTTAVAASLPIDTNDDRLLPVHLNPDKVFFTGGESTGEFCIHNLLNRIPVISVLAGIFLRVKNTRYFEIKKY
jgi:hypothetical protein